MHWNNTKCSNRVSQKSIKTHFLVQSNAACMQNIPISSFGLVNEIISEIGFLTLQWRRVNKYRGCYYDWPPTTIAVRYTTVRPNIIRFSVIQHLSFFFSTKRTPTWVFLVPWLAHSSFCSSWEASRPWSCPGPSFSSSSSSRPSSGSPSYSCCSWQSGNGNIEL